MNTSPDDLEAAHAAADPGRRARLFDLMDADANRDQQLAYLKGDLDILEPGDRAALAAQLRADLAGNDLYATAAAHARRLLDDLENGRPILAGVPKRTNQTGQGESDPDAESWYDADGGPWLFAGPGRAESLLTELAGTVGHVMIDGQVADDEAAETASRWNRGAGLGEHGANRRRLERLLRPAGITRPWVRWLCDRVRGDEPACRALVAIAAPASMKDPRTEGQSRLWFLAASVQVLGTVAAQDLYWSPGDDGGQLYAGPHASPVPTPHPFRAKCPVCRSVRHVDLVAGLVDAERPVNDAVQLYATHTSE